MSEAQEKAGKVLAAWATGTPIEGPTDAEPGIDVTWMEETLQAILEMANKYAGIAEVRGALTGALKALRAAGMVEAADMSTSDGLGCGPCMDVEDFAARVTGAEGEIDWRSLAKDRLGVIETLSEQLVSCETRRPARDRDGRGPFEAAIEEVAQATEGSAADLADVVYAQLDKLGISYDAH